MSMKMEAPPTNYGQPSHKMLTYISLITIILQPVLLGNFI